MRATHVGVEVQLRLLQASQRVQRASRNYCLFERGGVKDARLRSRVLETFYGFDCRMAPTSVLPLVMAANLEARHEVEQHGAHQIDVDLHGLVGAVGVVRPKLGDRRLPAERARSGWRPAATPQRRHLTAPRALSRFSAGFNPRRGDVAKLIVSLALGSGQT